MFFIKTLLIITWSLLIILGHHSIHAQADDYFNEIVPGEYIIDDFVLPFDPLIDVDKNTKKRKK